MRTIELQGVDKLMIFDDPLPWPILNDDFFSAENVENKYQDWWNIAVLSTDDMGKIESYILGYKTAADNLINEITEKQSREQDFLIYPILFLYRHYLELRLKSIIFYYERLKEDSSKKVMFVIGHDLSSLWRRVSHINADFFQEDSDLDATLAMEQYIKIFHKLDGSNADAFRYPIDKGGNPSLPQTFNHIHIRKLKDAMERMENYLEGTTAAILHQYEKPYLEPKPAIAKLENWGVTTYGVESLDPLHRYSIKEKSLYSLDWVEHLVYREQYDLKSFVVILNYAKTIWDEKGKKLNPDLFKDAKPYRDIQDLNISDLSKPSVMFTESILQLDLIIGYFGQWAVTPFGVESLSKKYPLQISKDNIHQYNWQLYMATEDWVNLREFVVTLGYAKQLWNGNGECLRPDTVLKATGFKELESLLERRKELRKMQSSKSTSSLIIISNKLMSDFVSVEDDV